MTIIRQHHARNRFAHRLDTLHSGTIGTSDGATYVVVFSTFNEPEWKGTQVRSEPISSSVRTLLYIECEEGGRFWRGGVTEPADRVTETLTIQLEDHAAD